MYSLLCVPDMHMVALCYLRSGDALESFRAARRILSTIPPSSDFDEDPVSITLPNQ
jgi:hypothetical protein